MKLHHQVCFLQAKYPLVPTQSQVCRGSRLCPDKWPVGPASQNAMYITSCWARNRPTDPAALYYICAGCRLLSHVSPAGAVSYKRMVGSAAQHLISSDSAFFMALTLLSIIYIAYMLQLVSDVTLQPISLPEMRDRTIDKTV